MTRNGDAAVSCSTDCTVRLWRVPYAPFESGSVEAEDRAVLQFHGDAAFKCAVQMLESQMSTLAAEVFMPRSHIPVIVGSYGARHAFSFHVTPQPVHSTQRTRMRFHGAVPMCKCGKPKQ